MSEDDENDEEFFAEAERLGIKLDRNSKQPYPLWRIKKWQAQLDHEHDDDDDVKQSIVRIPPLPFTNK